MKFSLIVYSAPLSAAAKAEQGGKPSSHTALHFAQALLDQGHELHRVFFYGDGVYHGAKPAPGPTESLTPSESLWSQLALQHRLDLVLCVTATEQRGIESIREGFQLSGLGQLVDALVNSDRCVTFR
jgi:tRNA 2-thiouridine synthesizing protein D